MQDDVPLKQHPTAKPASDEAKTSGPPSAPKEAVPAVGRKHLPKPPPSTFLLHKGKKRRRSATPSTSDDEEKDTSWDTRNHRNSMDQRRSSSQHHARSESTPTRTASLPQQLEATITTTPTSVTLTAPPPQQLQTSPSRPLVNQQSEDSETTTTPTACPPQVLCELEKISRQLEQHMANVTQQFADVRDRLTDIQRRMVTVEKCLHDRPASSMEAADAEVMAPVLGSERLTEEQRRLLLRSQVVTNDDHWTELEAALLESGQYEPFFAALVQTVKQRVTDRSDAHKTANATLRALIAEPYLAERVTMAGYKKGTM